MLPSTTRSRGGCLTCKERRKKCDETHPKCVRCVRGGFECKGYATAGAPRRARSAVPAQAQTNPPHVLISPGVAASHTVPGHSGTTANSTTSNNFNFASTVPMTVPYSLPLDNQQSSNTSLTTFAPPNPDQFSVLSNMGAFNSPAVGTFPDLSNGSAPLAPKTATQLVGLAPPPDDEDDDILDSEDLPPPSPLGKVFTSDQWNELLEFYSSFNSNMVFDWRGTRLDLTPVIRERATQSSVLRNAMLSLAALYHSFTDLENTESWKQQAMQFNNNARVLLVQELSRPEVPTRRKLACVMEVLLFEQLSTHRFDAYYNLLKQGTAFVVTTLGTNVVNIGSLQGIDTIEIALFTWCDISSTILTAKPSLLSYEYIIDPATRTSHTGLEWMVCCPDIVTHCIARISVLRPLMEMEGGASDTALAEAMQIEQDLRNWQPTPSPTRNAYLKVLRMAAQECWRYAALIHLYQSVHKVGPLHPVARDSLRQIINLARTIPPGKHPDRFLSTPYFLAGTVAITKRDRAFIRDRMMASWRDASVSEPLVLLDDIWTKTEQTGVPVDWNARMRERTDTMIMIS